MPRTIFAWRMGLAAMVCACIAGCHYGTPCRVEGRVNALGGCPIDATPTPAVAIASGNRETGPAPSGESLPSPTVEPVSAMQRRSIPNRIDQPTPSSECRTVDYEAVPSPQAATAHPLSIPRNIPGSESPPIRVPSMRPGTTPAQRRSEIEKLFADLEVIAPLDAPTTDAPPLSLSQLQSLAVAHNPLIRQAAADVESARGNAIQAGTYPNPHVGYQADTINTGKTGGYQGGNVSQTIVTGGKLRLARASADVDFQNAEVALRRARFDLATQVRSHYLGVLVAIERIKVNFALAQFSDRVYRLQVKRVAAGQAAAYEPLQLRVLAVQAQTQLIQSNHSYQSAWRKLAATLNCPDMSPQVLAGCINCPVPHISYEDARERILRTHTDLVTAQNAVVRARTQLQLARITPLCPNIDASTTIQHDFTTSPFGTVYSLQFGAPLPIFDTNRGNIIAAEGALVRACSEYERARNDLFVNLADTFARYETNSESAQQYRSNILADQVRAYRGAYQRYQADPDADFNDVVTSQQTLTTTISTYIQLLGDQWQAVADLAGLMQSDDLFGMGQPSP